MIEFTSLNNLTFYTRASHIAAVVKNPNGNSWQVFVSFESYPIEIDQATAEILKSALKK